MSTDSSYDIRKIIHKLGHDLHEVRLRSLQNILSKVNNCIISFEELLHIRELYIHLLEWLKQPLSNQNEIQLILNLLHPLSKFPAGSQTLIDLGGVEIFSVLRQSVGDDEKSHELIDNLLNNLFLVHNEVDTHAVLDGHIMQESMTCAEQSNEYSAEKSTEILLQYETLKDHQHSTFESILVDTVEPETAREIPSTPQHPDEPVSSEETTSHCSAPETSQKLVDQHSCDSFPWIPLTSGDRQILSVTDNRLQSASPELILQSCQFLRCVLFHDFPAEVFIQRPSIFRTLLSMIGKHEGKNTEIVREILGCLTDLTRNLHKRSLQNQREDLQVASMQYEGDDFETTLMTECFMQDQCSLNDFSVKSLLATVNLLKIYFKEHRVFSEVILLNVTVTKLLHHTDFKSYWGDSSGNKMVYGLLTLFHKFNTTISDIPVPDKPSIDLGGHLNEVKFLIISRVLTKLILATVPDSRLYEAVTEGLVLFLEKILCNVSFLSHMSSLRSALEKILRHADANFYNRYIEATRIVKSMISIDKWKDCISVTGKYSEEEVLSIMREIILTIQYHCHTDFIHSAVDLCCKKFTSAQQGEGIGVWSEMLLTLMHHPSVGVVRKVYSSLLKVMKVAFSESLVTTPLSAKHQLANLLVEKKTLNSIIKHGVTHKDENVSTTSRTIVTTLLLSRLNMSAEMWKGVLHSLTLLIPTLQGYLGASDEGYSKSLLALVEHPYTILDAEGRSSGLSNVEQMRLLARLFFMRVDKVRCRAHPLILLRIINRNKERKVVRTYPSASEFSMGDIFVFSVQRLAVLVGSSSCFEDVSHENVQKLWDVVRDVAVNDELRHSAAEQLAILTKDSLLQNRITQNDSYSFLVDEINKIANGSDSVKLLAASKYLLSLLKILKNILATHATLRHILALQEGLYLDLIEIAILCVKQEDIRYEISCILTYLLFCDLFKIPEASKDNLILPRDMRHNYRFPVEFSFTAKKKTTENEVLPADDVLWGYIKHSCWLQSHWFTDVNIKSKCNAVVHVTHEEKTRYNNGVSSLMSSISQGLCTAPDHYHAISHLGSLHLLIFLSDNKMDSQGTFCSEISAVTEDLINDGLIRSIMSKPPISDSDAELFKCVVFFLSTVIELDVQLLVPSFNSVVLSQNVANIIGNHGNQLGSRGSNKPDLWVKQGLMSLVSSTLEHKNRSVSARLWDADTEIGISSLIVSLYQNLSVGGSESYYNLPLLEVMLECFTHLLVYRNWSSSLSKNICHQLFHWLSQIVISFHFDRSTAGFSFMGKGIVKKSVVCMCHMVREISIIEKNTSSWNNWLKNSVDAAEGNGDVPRLPWLVPLLSDRLIDVRWGALALSSALITEDTGEEIIINEYQSLAGGIWATTIHILLDAKECFMVRKQACALLTDLVRRAVAQLKHNLDVWTQMVVQDTDSQIKVTGVDAFFMLLDHLDFFPQFGNLFSNDRSIHRQLPSMGEEISLSRDMSTATGADSFGTVEVLRYQEKGTVSHSSYTEDKVKRESISYKSSLLLLLSNLISLAPHIVIQKLNEYQLLPSICSTWSPSLLVQSLHHNQQKGIKLTPEQELVAQLKLMQSVSKLLLIVLQNDAQHFSALLGQNDLLPKVLLSFQLCRHGNEQCLPLYIPVWIEAIALMESILQLNSNNEFDKACSVVKEHLQYIGASLLLSADAMKSDNTLLQKFLLFIFSALKTATVSCNNDILLLDSLQVDEGILALLKKSDHTVEFLHDGGFSVGELLCVIFIYIKSKFGASKPSSLVSTTLAYLFTLSKKATSIAFNNGLVESLVEEIKDIVIRINVTSSMDRKAMSKKKVSLMHDLCCVLSLTRDFCSFDDTIKVSFVSSNLLFHLQSIWGLSSTDAMLRRCLLQLLVMLSANCEDAQVGMCTMMVESTLCEEVSFLNHIVKLFVSFHEGATCNGKFDTCLPLCFDILVNLCNQSQCRHMIIKSNLFSLFVNAQSLVYSAKKGHRSCGKKLLNEWIKLISIATFHCDAGKALGKVPGSFNVIAEIIKSSSVTKKVRGLTTLRNLMFVQAHKQTITSDAVLLESVLSQLNTKSHKLKLLVLSFLWVALFENQKAKVFLKKMNLEAELCNVNNSVDNGEGCSMEYIQLIVANVQTLLVKTDT